MATISLRNAGVATLPAMPPTGMKALAKAQYFNGGTCPLPISLRFLATRVPSPRYDQIFRKACHNCFQKEYSTSLFEALDKCKNIEIDFYDTVVGFNPFGMQKIIPGSGKPKYWFVRHELIGSNNNCCSSSGGGLKSCLNDVRDWSANHEGEGHEVITVFVDKKQGWGIWGDQRSPEDLDELIMNCIPKTKLYRPKDLKGNFKSLRQAAQKGAWPKMNELRNKIIFVLTGGDEMRGHNSTQSEYVNDRRSDAVLFVAPNTEHRDDILNNPDQFNDEEADWVVFHNLKIGNEKLGPLIRGQGYLSRVWGPIEDPIDDTIYSRLVVEKINFIALHKFKISHFNGGTMEGTII